jgi:hypothetical protein
MIAPYNCLRSVPRPEKRENSSKKFKNRSILANFSQFWPYFMNLNHVFFKVGRRTSHALRYIHFTFF